MGKLKEIEMKKITIFINKPVFLGLAILEIFKIVKYEFFMILWNWNMEKKQNYITKIQIALWSAQKGVYTDISKDVKTRLDTSKD